MSDDRSDRKLKTAMSMPTVLRGGRAKIDTETTTAELRLSKTTSSFQMGEQMTGERGSTSEPAGESRRTVVVRDDHQPDV